MVRVPPPEWSDERLEEDRTKAIEAFRNERLTEPLEEYLEVFEVYRDARAPSSRILKGGFNGLKA